MTNDPRSQLCALLHESVALRGDKHVLDNVEPKSAAIISNSQVEAPPPQQKDNPETIVISSSSASESQADELSEPTVSHADDVSTPNGFDINDLVSRGRKPAAEDVSSDEEDDEEELEVVVGESLNSKDDEREFDEDEREEYEALVAAEKAALEQMVVSDSESDDDADGTSSNPTKKKKTSGEYSSDESAGGDLLDGLDLSEADGPRGIDALAALIGASSSDDEDESEMVSDDGEASGDDFVPGDDEEQEARVEEREASDEMESDEAARDEDEDAAIDKQLIKKRKREHGDPRFDTPEVKEIIKLQRRAKMSREREKYERLKMAAQHYVLAVFYEGQYHKKQERQGLPESEIVSYRDLLREHLDDTHQTVESRMARYVQAIDSKVSETIARAKSADFEPLRHALDFVGGAAEVHDGPVSSTLVANRCAVTHLPAKTDDLHCLVAAYRSANTGEWKRRELVLLRELVPLVHSLWFVVNMERATQDIVTDHLVLVADKTNEKLTVQRSAEIIMLQITKDEHPVTTFMDRFRSALDEIDSSLATMKELARRAK